MSDPKTEPTPLDTAHALMDADLSDDAARLGFYQCLADSELFVTLKQEASGDQIDPELVSVDGEAGAPPVDYILAFDLEERLASFSDGPAPYVALPGRIIAQMLAGSGVGLALNLGAPSSILIPNEAMGWLAETLGGTPEERDGMIEELLPPAGLPDALITGLEAKLASAAGLCERAYIVKTRFEGGAEGWLIAFIDAPDTAQEPLARATQEALIFSGTDMAGVDVAFFAKDDAMTARLAKVGLVHYLPKPAAPEAPAKPKAPGSDPSKPPILR